MARKKKSKKAHKATGVGMTLRERLQKPSQSAAALAEYDRLRGINPRSEAGKRARALKNLIPVKKLKSNLAKLEKIVAARHGKKQKANAIPQPILEKRLTRLRRIVEVRTSKAFPRY